MYHPETRNLTTGNLYFHPNPFLRWIFWKRLKVVFRLAQKGGESPVLDLGCGAGELLPSLAGCFSTVAGLDLNITNARRLVEHFRLAEVELHEGDFMNIDFSSRRFRCVIAADVLEHQRDLDLFLLRMQAILEPAGKLIVCIPNEFFLYRLGRAVFRINPPPDHYQRCSRIMERMSRLFQRETYRHVPSKLMPLFLVVRWRRKEGCGPGRPG